MRKYRIYIIYIVVISLATTLCGCTEHKRDISDTALVRAIGIDGQNGSMTVTVCTGEDGGIMTGTGRSVAQAENEMRRVSDDANLFFSHAGYVVIGGNTKGADFRAAADYIGRAPELRIGTLVFTAGESARELFERPRDEAPSLMIKTIPETVRQTGAGFMTRYIDVMRDIEKYGCALIAELSDTDGRIAFSGFEIVTEDGAAARIPDRLTTAAALARGKTEKAVTEISSGQGTVSLLLTGADVNSVKTDGGVSIRMKLVYELAGSDGATDMTDDANRAFAERAAAEKEAGAVWELAELSSALGLDFLKMGIAKDVPVSVSAQAEIKRTYDVIRP